MLCIDLLNPISYSGATWNIRFLELLAKHQKDLVEAGRFNNIDGLD